MSRSEPRDHLVLSLYPRESECIACGALLVAPKRGIPVYEGEALPDSWMGEWAGFDACDRCADAQATITVPTPLRRLREIDIDTTRPTVPSRWRRMDLLDPISQLYDDADCDSWHVPGQRSTGPCDPAWKGDYDRAGCISRVYGANVLDCDGAPDFEPVHERERTGMWAGYDGDCDGDGTPAPRCALSGPIYTPCTYADCDLELGGGCVLRGPPA